MEYEFVYLCYFYWKKGNKMLNGYEGMDIGGVFWMFCVNNLRYCIWKFYVYVGLEYFFVIV